MGKGAVRKVHTYYKDGKLDKRTCPKCEDKPVMAEHKDRFVCGKCHYMVKKE